MFTYLQSGAPLCAHSPALAAVSPVHNAFPKIVSPWGEMHLKARGLGLCLDQCVCPQLNGPTLGNLCSQRQNIMLGRFAWTRTLIPVGSALNIEHTTLY